MHGSRQNNNCRQPGAQWFLFLLVLVGIVCSSVEAKRKNANHIEQQEIMTDDDIPNVHFLVEMIGQEIYAMVKKPKYKFYIYMTIGTLPNETNTIVLLSTLCNILYGISVLFGFLFLPRGPMLLASLATLWIGPGLVLILLGSIACVVAAFAMYPITSVAVMCAVFFLTSKLGQTIGKRLGLDSDGDGDVDWLDVLHFMARTEIGSSVGLMRVHELLNQANQDPFQEIHHRLNDIDQNTKTIGSSRNVSLGDLGEMTPDKPKNN